MRAEAKAETLAALREVYDGAWTRHLGTDGGRTLSWAGKIGLVFGATEVYLDDPQGAVAGESDSDEAGEQAFEAESDASGAFGPVDHYSIIGSLGDRFLLCRLGSSYGGQLQKALNHKMRNELAAAVAGLFAAPLTEPAPLSQDEFERLDNVVALVVRLRAHVIRDRHSREIDTTSRWIQRRQSEGTPSRP
jgi:hypothetical protein